ncbi:DUF397 domain-containing protein [Nocardiopsis sp. NPDC006938]|uniref:DUF397 domain-containing protein n=1 Tax=Nocardiopsis sp. NPDC006938 TaxID=3364337 RepID=UPI0036A92A42
MSDYHPSSYSDGTGGYCVEVSEGRATQLRDTQNRDLGTVRVHASEWTAALLDAVRTK